MWKHSVKTVLQLKNSRPLAPNTSNTSSALSRRRQRNNESALRSLSTKPIRSTIPAAASCARGQGDDSKHSSSTGFFQIGAIAFGAIAVLASGESALESAQSSSDSIVINHRTYSTTPNSNISSEPSKNVHSASSGTKPSREKKEAKVPASKKTLLRNQVSNIYDVNKVLGSGGFGEVKVGRHKRSNTPVAIKKMSKKYTTEAKFRQEVGILKRVSGKNNVIELRDAFETPDAWVLVTELAEGGELFDRLIDYGTYSEKDASRIIREICRALKYLHSKNIVHADVKPENIVLTSKDDATRIKLVDFGLAYDLEGDSSSRPCFADGSGTIAYSAPEVLRGLNGGPEVDMWALGVVLYILIAGVHPFDVENDSTDEEMKERIIKGDFNFDQRIWRRVSSDVKGLISKLLDVDPKKRLSADEVMEHSWIANVGLLSSLRLWDANKLTKFSKAKKHLNSSIAALLVNGAFNVSKSKLEKERDISWFYYFLQNDCNAIRLAIDQLDPTQKGYIDENDLKRVAKQLGSSLSEDEIRDMISSVDNDEHSKHIQYSDIERIIAGFGYHVYKNNEIVFQQGDKSTNMFILGEGTIECTMDFGRDEKSKDGLQSTVKFTRDAGEYFGEEILSDSCNGQRISTARCTAESCRVLALNQEDVLSLTGEYETLKKNLQHQAQEHMHDLVVGFVEQGMKDTCVRKFNAGDVICSEGELCDKFYVIRSGTLNVVSSNKKGKAVTVEKLGTGDYFPLGVFEEKTLRDATVRCSTPVEVIEVSGVGLRRMLQDPSTKVMLNSLKSETQKRRQIRALKELGRAVTRRGNK